MCIFTIKSNEIVFYNYIYTIRKIYAYFISCTFISTSVLIRCHVVVQKWQYILCSEISVTLCGSTRPWKLGNERQWAESRTHIVSTARWSGSGWLSRRCQWTTQLSADLQRQKKRHRGRERLGVVLSQIQVPLFTLCIMTIIIRLLYSRNGSFSSPMVHVILTQRKSQGDNNNRLTFMRVYFWVDIFPSVLISYHHFPVTLLLHACKSQYFVGFIAKLPSWIR